MPLEFAMPSPKGYCGLAVDMRCRSSFFFSGTPPSAARLGTADDRPPPLTRPSFCTCISWPCLLTDGKRTIARGANLSSSTEITEKHSCRIVVALRGLQSGRHIAK